MRFSSKDQELIDKAYETTYRSTLNQLIAECKSKRAKNIIRNIMKEFEGEGVLE